MRGQDRGCLEFVGGLRILRLVKELLSEKIVFVSFQI